MEQRWHSLGIRIKRQYMLAACALVLERGWAASAPLFWLVFLFLGVSHFGFWGVVAPAFHVVGLILFAAGLVAVGRTFWQRFFWPKDDEVRSALERESHIPHRPFRSFDAVAAKTNADGEKSRLFWDLHQQQQNQNLAKLNAFWPDFSFDLGDIYSLRSAVLLFALSGFIMSSGQASERFAFAFTPQFFGPDPIVQVDIWASPPDYTALAPVLLVKKPVQQLRERNEIIKLPEGSRIIARVSGGNEDLPILLNGETKYAFSKIAGMNFHAEVTEISGGKWQLIKDGDELATWTLQIMPDLAPIVRMPALPTITDRKALQLTAEVSDDYGIVELIGQISRGSKGDGIKLKLPFIQGAKKAESRSYHDLTQHVWSGLPVELSIVARDEKGQLGRSKSVRMILPERDFQHPIAKILIEERKKLIADPSVSRFGVIGTLDALVSLPHILNENLAAHLMVSVARGILLIVRDEQRIEEAAELLWHAALKLENGNLTVAEQALRDAENALMEALNNGANDAEIKRLVEELKDAMQKFLAELSKNQGEMQSEMPSNTDGQRLAAQDLNNLLDKVDQFARSGARDEARDLLRQLQDVLENLQAAGTSLTPSQMAGQKLLDDLGKLMGDQQGLMDDTLKSSRRTEPSSNSTEKSDAKAFKKLGDQQEALRQMLGNIMGELGLGGDIPDALGKAERAMNSARQALELQQPKAAENLQKQVMEQLLKGSSDLAEQMMQGQGAQGGGQFGSNMGRDPLGRPMPSRNGRGLEKIDHKLFQKNFLSTTKLIMDEVRRRLSDPNRSDLEKQYLKRLLERFQ